MSCFPNLRGGEYGMWMELPLDNAQDALEAMRAYLVRPPSHHLSSAWDLVYLALSYITPDVKQWMHSGETKSVTRSETIVNQ
jgi:hypothetical protein